MLFYCQAVDVRAQKQKQQQKRASRFKTEIDDLAVKDLCKILHGRPRKNLVAAETSELPSRDLCTLDGGSIDDSMFSLTGFHVFSVNSPFSPSQGFMRSELAAACSGEERRGEERIGCQHKNALTYRGKWSPKKPMAAAESRSP